eukprot:CAMPEP_0174994864 /NCGR_PEP_ID=MMETSP0004_2-20121128/23875_1 /TAXON_ID=420556 /ORGANISM="Ochromonas sp., Strain CCMP1393" /LENGTH=713 /DNA_ID=CAMNT_0016249153 /DNA_START=54 /DNA_END=2195 /DNA_ORIENTATION=+
MKAVFSHKNYTLKDGDKIVRNDGAPPLTAAEDGEILQEVARYVEARIISDFKFVSIQIPEGEDNSTSILASPNWSDATKLLMIVQNSYGSQLGIFSRSICFEQGISKGTWLPYIQRAVSVGYAVLILRPNTNSNMNGATKIPIKGSESPEIHALNVWENIVQQAEKAKHISFVCYGNGASLCKDMFLREMVNTSGPDSNRIKAFVSIEASSIVSKDDSADVREALGNVTINLELNQAPRGNRLAYRRESLGCTSLSLGMPPGVTDLNNVAAGVSIALDSVFKFLSVAEQVKGDQLCKSFASIYARDNGLEASTAVVLVNPNAAEEELTPLPPGGGAALSSPAPPTPPAPKKGFFARIFGGSGKDTGKAETKPGEEKLTVQDFDLLKIVGKGAFGKVMLVRKKASKDEGKVYAMKVLKKDVVSAKGQIEHTKSERDILFEVRHPYIVRLRYAFQSEDKLYLVTDYYNGGTLFYHLRKSRQFDEARARFYAAQLLSALDHLHKNHIIHRDLELENVLMDHLGHLALTDFGLSKQNIDFTGGATTFCGTAEYIAPELLKGQKYGAPVDWWSFGILIFEMMQGRTPFFDKNRKLMFYRIINTEPSFPPTFSPAACDCIRGLLRVNEMERLGSGPTAAKEIMSTAFFSVIDFDALMKRELPPPFKPDVTGELDTKYVPKSYLQAEAKDSIDESSKKKKDKNPTFDAFTFQGERTLDQS